MKSKAKDDSKDDQRHSEPVTLVFSNTHRYAFIKHGHHAFQSWLRRPYCTMPVKINNAPTTNSAFSVQNSPNSIIGVLTPYICTRLVYAVSARISLGLWSNVIEVIKSFAISRQSSISEAKCACCLALMLLIASAMYLPASC